MIDFFAKIIISIPPGKVWKLNVFWRFQGVLKYCNYFAKGSIINVWQGSKYTSGRYQNKITWSWCLLTHLFPMYPFPTPWKRQGTVRFSDVFRGKRKGASGTNGLLLTLNNFFSCFGSFIAISEQVLSTELNWNELNFFPWKDNHQFRV